MVKTIGFLSLGCARNLADSEVLGARLKRKGYKIVDLGSAGDGFSGRASQATAVLINTCSFIKEAKEESIRAILDLIELKRQGKFKRLIVSGCLSQRYADELPGEFPEIDAVSGVISLNHTQERLRFTPRHYAYVKLCEGCISNCSFCVIPRIKQGFVSRPIESVLAEVKDLETQGCREVNLIGQDISAYGLDLYGKLSLAGMIKQILRNSKRINWLRLLYLSPERLNEELIQVVSSSPRVAKYIDLPLQHINNRILGLMRRGTDSSLIFELLDKLRRKIPGVAVRSSLIVGFPSETEKEFRQLLDFVKTARFERLGLFIYSREEGTRAYGLRGQVPQRIKQERYNIIMSAQQEIARKINAGFLHKSIQVLIEEKQEEGLYIGRSQYDAPEVDGLVYVKSKKELTIGDFVDVEITDTLEYDLLGEPQ
ncbi:MiaB/RimO family radical SAM methylthiotransferase [Candidatus Omnitrophota bacterium]